MSGHKIIAGLRDAVSGRAGRVTVYPHEIRPEPGKIGYYAQPTLGLRFLNGALQQAWMITDCCAPEGTSRSIEWRDVPNES